MSKYSEMKLLCMFDLPMDTNEQKREYRNFRKELLKNGFVMMQYSIYSRTCPNREYSKKFSKKLKTFAPTEGNVRLLTVTQKQYDDMELILGNKNHCENIMTKRGIIVI